MDTLEQRHGEPSIFPDGSQRPVSALFELYGDEWLVIPAMHYRWHRNRDWALRAFGELIAPGASPEEQLVIGSKRAAPFAQAAVSLGAEPHMHAAIERSYENLLAELDLHFSEFPYLLGTRPCMGDFGLFGPLYAHQYRDPASGELMRRLAPNVVAWVERMADPTTPRSGKFLADDRVPETLQPILRRMMRELFPVLADTHTRLLQWLGEHPDERRIPRGLGTHVFTIEGTQGQRTVGPYKLWMLQRVLDVYRVLASDERRHADALINTIDGQALRGFDRLPRLRRDGLSVAVSG